jgi:hypothetical protein
VIVYDEGSEWTATTGNITANTVSTAQAYSAAHSTAVTSATSISTITWQNLTGLSFASYATLSFQVRLTAALADNSNIQVQFFRQGVAVSDARTAVLNKATLNAWQGVSFAIGDFATSLSSFDAVRFSFTAASSGTLYIDYVLLQTGIQQPNPAHRSCNAGIRGRRRLLA